MFGHPGGEQGDDVPQQLGAALVDVADRAVGDGDDLRRLEGPRLGGAALEEQAHLAERLPRLHEGDDRLAPVDRAVGDGDAALGPRRTARGPVAALGEEHVAPAQRADLGGVGEQGELVVAEVAEQLDVGEQLGPHHRPTLRRPTESIELSASGTFPTLARLPPLQPHPSGPTGSSMPFDVGDKVVYPHHGAATIEKREKMEAFGETREYLVLRLAYGDLTLKVPADNTDSVGLREVINDEEVEEVFAVLRKKEARMPTNWSRRFKNHVEKLKSGDIYQVAEVVRNLSLRDKEKGLSAGEKRMLAKARQILVSELTFALNVNEEEAERRLDVASSR